MFRYKVIGRDTLHAYLSGEKFEEIIDCYVAQKVRREGNRHISENMFTDLGIITINTIKICFGNFYAEKYSFATQFGYDAYKK